MAQVALEGDRADEFRIAAVEGHKLAKDATDRDLCVRLVREIVALDHELVSVARDEVLAQSHVQSVQLKQVLDPMHQATSARVIATCAPSVECVPCRTEMHAREFLAKHAAVARLGDGSIRRRCSSRLRASNERSHSCLVQAVPDAGSLQDRLWT